MYMVVYLTGRNCHPAPSQFFSWSKSSTMNTPNSQVQLFISIAAASSLETKAICNAFQRLFNASRTIDFLWHFIDCVLRWNHLKLVSASIWILTPFLTYRFRMLKIYRAQSHFVAALRTISFYKDILCCSFSNAEQCIWGGLIGLYALHVVLPHSF